MPTREELLRWGAGEAVDGLPDNSVEEIKLVPVAYIDRPALTDHLSRNRIILIGQGLAAVIEFLSVSIEEDPGNSRKILTGKIKPDAHVQQAVLEDWYQGAWKEDAPPTVYKKSCILQVGERGFTLTDVYPTERTMNFDMNEEAEIEWKFIVGNMALV